VQSGDVSAVPVPAVVWLFGSGLMDLIDAAGVRALKFLSKSILERRLFSRLFYGL